MFEILFKYPVEYFVEGDLVLALPGWQIALLPVAIMALGFVVLGYFSVRGRTRVRDRMAIACLRSFAISLVLFSLSRPLLEVTSQLPQPNLVGVLLDNSISMTVRDFANGPRSNYITRQIDSRTGDLLRSLQQRFDTRLFKFGADTQAITDLGAMDYNEGDSNLSRALEVVQESLQGEPLAGLIVISDGAVEPGAQLDAALLALKAARIPVYSIGVGQAQYQRDIEISRVKLPRQVLKGSRVVADVVITQQGYNGQRVELVVEDDGRIVHKQPIQLEPGRQSIMIPLDTEDDGARQLNFYLANETGEQIAANNSQQAMLTVDNDRKRILYFEGEPRFELKFVRRAVAEDKSLGVSGLIRTADAKFYRVGIESQQELRNGFPTTRAELFAYDALILGSVEISLLSREQQEMIVEFVNQRGGGLLMLGGRHAFTEGGYRDSLLHELSPVVMPAQAQPEFSREIKIQPTAAAWVHPALLLADSNEKSMARWLTLPALTIVNPVRQIKPGATLLLTSTPSAQDTPYVAMAVQRYGRGKVIAFPVQNSWIWQMHQDIDLEDQTHEILWRQLLRWLVEAVPPQIDLKLSAHEIHTGGVIKLRSEVLQAGFEQQAPSELRAVLTAPNGLEQTRPLIRHPSLASVFQAEIPAADSGDYRLHVEFDAPGEVIRSAEARFTVSPEGGEFYQSQMNENLLRKISAATGGAFLSPDAADQLADALDSHQRGADPDADLATDASSAAPFAGAAMPPQPEDFDESTLLSEASFAIADPAAAETRAAPIAADAFPELSGQPEPDSPAGPGSLSGPDAHPDPGWHSDPGWRRLARSLSHEIRNPLVSIRTFAELLPEHYEDETFRARFAELVGRDVAHISSVVTRLQDIAENEDRAPEALDVSAMLESLLEERRERFAEGRLLVLRELERDAPLAWSEANGLRVALAGLLDRALETLPERGDLFVATRRIERSNDREARLRILLRYHNPELATAGARTTDLEELRPSANVLEFVLAETVAQAHGGTLVIDSSDAQETLILMDLRTP